MTARLNKPQINNGTLPFIKISSNWALLTFIKSSFKIHYVQLIFTYLCTKLPATAWESAFILLSFMAGLYVVNKVLFLVVKSSQNRNKLVDKKYKRQETFIT
jgi:hypothetical protein